MRIFVIGVAVAVLSTSAVARGGHGGSHSSGSHSSYHSHSSFSSHSSYRSPGEHYVSGYTRSNGTHVSGHYQTNANGTRNDNYSSRGNINPHTGEPGTKPRDEDVPHN